MRGRGPPLRDQLPGCCALTDSRVREPKMGRTIGNLSSLEARRGAELGRVFAIDVYFHTLSAGALATVLPRISRTPKPMGAVAKSSWRRLQRRYWQPTRADSKRRLRCYLDQTALRPRHAM